jgi:hypothetical protein
MGHVLLCLPVAGRYLLHCFNNARFAKPRLASYRRCWEWRPVRKGRVGEHQRQDWQQVKELQMVAR